MSDDISNRPLPPNAVTHPLPSAPAPVTSAALEASRAHTIRVLTDRFADDTLSVEEFEARLDRMYKASTLAELDALLREVDERVPRVAVAAPSAYEVSAPRRLFAFMSSTRRTGRWPMPRRLEVRAVMSDLFLDLRDVALPAGVCEIDGFVLMANVEILVPPGVIVEEMPLGVMSSIENDAVDEGQAGPGAPRIRLTGAAMMSNIEVRIAPSGINPRQAWKLARKMKRKGGWPAQ